MRDYVAFRRIKLEELYPAATAIRYHDRWYSVLGYDADDNLFYLEDYSEDGFQIHAENVHHSDIRVEVCVRSFDEVLDLFN